MIPTIKLTGAIIMKAANILIVILLSATLSGSALPEEVYFGTTGTLAGTVIDQQSKEPLAGVNIVFLGTRYGGTTDENGKYKIYNIPPGRYSVQYSFIGFRKHTVEQLKINVDETTLMNVELVVGELELEEVVVTAEELVVKQDVTGTSHVVEAHQIDMLPVDNFAQIIATQPGVTRDLHIRGGRKSEILYLVDGLPYTEAAGGTAGGMLPKSAIQEMKILTGGFDAEYGNAMSGVVNIITRNGSREPTLNTRLETDNYFGNPETSREYLSEITAGGPLLSGDLSYFTATDYRTSGTRWQEDFDNFFSGPVFREFNNITKFDYNLTDNTRISAQALITYTKDRRYEYRWRKNLSGLPESRRFSNRISLGINHFLTENTFFNFSLSRYDLSTRLGPESRDDLDPQDLWQYDFMLQFVESGSRLWWADEQQVQYTAKGNFTSQISPQSTFKVGFEVTQYDMDIERMKYEPYISFYGKPLLFMTPLDYSTNYSYTPRSGSVYAQNKLVFMDEGTLNLGLRWDFLDPQAERPNLEWIPTGTDDYEKEISEWVPATMKHEISPRLGFSMPLSDRDFLLTNYGYFFQMPLFEYLYSGLDINLKKKNSVLVGNPDMKPMITKAMELSYRRKFAEDMSLTVTWFDKKTENLIDAKTFLASDSKALDDGYFAQYVNSPHAHSTGLEVTIEKHNAGPLYGRLSYSLMKAEGVAERGDSELRYLQWGFEPFNLMHPLSWDQRHTINGLLSSDLPRDVSLDVLVNYHSPRPYTYFPSEDGFTTPETVLYPNNERMEHNLYIDMKLRKRFSFTDGIDGLKGMTFYIDVRNLLDKRNVLWITSDGEIGGELHDPGAYDMPRRTRVGFELSFR